MDQPVPDPGGSASIYQYYLTLLAWLGFGRPAWAPWLFAALAVASMLLSLAPILRAVAVSVRYVRRWWSGRRDPRRVRRRALFADHIESQLRRLDEKEEWRDHRFARLEAEVEMEGEQHRLLPRWLYRRRASLRREKSLSRALQRSDERLIILQGEPGAGKSVALRNAARAMAVRVMRRPTLDGRIPLYVNLKELRPVAGQLDSETVRSYVLGQLNRANSRDVEQFLADEFTTGMREGTWLFLFDSFDEIPEVLTATESDETVGRYADVLYDFLHGMNASPGVVASREFKGPRRFGWPRFTVQRLTERQKRELIRKADLDEDAEAEVFAALASADPMVTQLSGNPMLLGLLCEHVRTVGSFPTSSHTVFETYVHSRLERDQDRVRRRYSVEPGELREVAEEIAFWLTAESGLGLSPSRAEIARLVVGMEAGGRPIDATRLGRCLDALEYIKLAQAPEGSGSDDQRPFTFAHRRFQEYFATCVVIREPHRVSVNWLLLDGRWRETAVALLQTQQGEAVSALVREAGRILAQGVAAVEAVSDAAGRSSRAADEQPEFAWPPGSLHLLDLLDAGLGGRPEDVPDDLRVTVSRLLRAAWASGRRHHQLWAVQGTLLAEVSTAEEILEESCTSKSLLLRNVAYRYAGRLPKLSPGLSRHLRLALIDQAAQGRLLFDWPTVRAQLARLNEPLPYLRAARLLRWNPPLTGLLITLIFVSGAQTSDGQLGWAAGWLMSVTLIGGFSALDMWITARLSRTTAVSWFSDAVVHAIARLIGVAVGIVVAVNAMPADAQPGGHPAWSLLSLFALAYSVIWPSASVAAVAWGVDVRLSRWLFLPLAVVPAAVRTLLRMPRRQRAKGVSLLFAAVTLLPATLVFLTWLTSRYPGLAGVIRTGAYGLGGATAVLLTVSYVLHERVDRRHLQSIPPGVVLDAPALAQLVNGLRSDNGLRHLVDLIRQHRIDCTADSMVVFSDLMAAAQRYLARRDALPWWQRQLGRLWGDLWRTVPSTGNISEGSLDELARLIAERTDLSPTQVMQQPVAVQQRDSDDAGNGVRQAECQE